MTIPDHIVREAADIADELSWGAMDTDLDGWRYLDKDSAAITIALALQAAEERGAAREREENATAIRAMRTQQEGRLSKPNMDIPSATVAWMAGTGNGLNLAIAAIQGKERT